MNTPKLDTALISSLVPGRAAQVAASSATPAIAFSQLLGAKREQAASNAPITPAQNRRDQEPPVSGRASSAEIGAKTEQNARAASERQVADNSAKQTSVQASAGGKAPNARRSEGAGTPPADGADPVVAQQSGTSVDGRAGSDLADVEASANDNATVVVAAPVQVVVQQLADAAVAVAPAPLIAPAESESEVSALNSGTSSLGAGLASSALEGEGVTLAVSVPAQGATTSAPPATQANAVAESALPTAALVRNTPNSLDIGQASPLTARHAAIQATSNEAAAAPALNAAGLSVAPFEAPAASAYFDAATPATHQAATHALPTLTVSTAAALSLQDFTAMVQAARATSGTALQPSVQASVTPTGVAAGVNGAGLGGVPIPGLLPGQSFATASPLGGNIATPLASPQWATEFGRQFISIAKSNNGLGQIAELRLDPPELGPLRITINLNDNVAHAVFSSPHASVRQTVENALPQLQQMLQQAGISLGQANVNDQHSGQASQDDQSGHAQFAGTPNGTHDTGSSDATLARPTSRSIDPNSLVDTFA